MKLSLYCAEVTPNRTESGEQYSETVKFLAPAPLPDGASGSATLTLHLTRQEDWGRYQPGTDYELNILSPPSSTAIAAPANPPPATAPATNAKPKARTSTTTQ